MKNIFILYFITYNIIFISIFYIYKSSNKVKLLEYKNNYSLVKKNIIYNTDDYICINDELSWEIYPYLKKYSKGGHYDGNREKRNNTKLIFNYIVKYNGLLPKFNHLLNNKDDFIFSNIFLNNWLNYILIIFVFMIVYYKIPFYMVCINILIILYNIRFLPDFNLYIYSYLLILLVILNIIPLILSVIHILFVKYNHYILLTSLLYTLFINIYLYQMYNLPNTYNEFYSKFIDMEYYNYDNHIYIKSYYLSQLKHLLKQYV